MNIESLKISIITVSYNSAKHIEDTILSVVNQTYQNKEYIIIDGGSSDGTIDIIKKYENHITYWISEKDDGMYDAINKGIKNCTGDYIYILNSDDILYNFLVLQTICKFIVQNPKFSAYYGNTLISRNNLIENRRTMQVNYNNLLYSRHCTFVPHPSFFISKTAASILKEYNLSYKFVSDFDYILRCFQLNLGVKYIPVNVAIFKYHSESISISKQNVMTSERILLLRHYRLYNTNFLFRSLFFSIIWIKYKLINTFF